MPSRRSPSQRTPEGRQGRQMAAMSTGTNSGRLISASSRGTTGTTPPASDTAASAAGAATGWAFYVADFSTTSITSANVAYIHCNTISLDSAVGSTGVTATTTDSIQIGAGLYVITETFTMQPTTNAAASDVHVVNYEFDVRTLAGTAPPFGANCALTSTMIIPTGGTGVISPGFQIYCTGGTDRVYELSSDSAYVSFIRFDLP